MNEHEDSLKISKKSIGNIQEMYINIGQGNKLLQRSTIFNGGAWERYVFTSSEKKSLVIICNSTRDLLISYQTEDENVIIFE